MDATPQQPGPEPASAGGSPAEPRYLEPDRFTRHVVNPLVAWLTRRGLSVWGSRVLRVRGRSSGRWRETPVNVLSWQGERYLVAARGDTQWVRNLRASGSAELRLGRRKESITAVELSDAEGAHAEKVVVLRQYLRRWKLEVGAFFDGVSAASTDSELAAVGPQHPVFRIRTVA